jgi:hypothetical protein
MKTFQVAAAVTFALASASALASPFSVNVTNDVYSGVVNGTPTARDGNDGSPDLYGAVNQLLGTSYTANKDLDARFVQPDSVFYGTGSHSIALIGLTAGNSNTLGIYTDIGVGANKTALLGPLSGFGIPHAGTAADPYTGATFNATGAFGWYLQSNSSYFYSESALNVADQGMDHMMTFALPELNGQTRYINSGSGAQAYTFANAFLIGWEDLHLNNGVLGDDDYDDMIYVVDFRPINVAEPASLAIMGLGLGLAGFVARRRKA